MHFFMQNDSYKKSGRDQQRGGQYEEEPPVITCFRNLWLLRLCWNFRLFRITYCLRFVVDVGVNGQLDTVFIQAFKYNNFLPASALPSKVKTTSTVPSAVSATKVVSAVTCSPFTRSGWPVDLSIRMPFTVYSVPTFRFCVLHRVNNRYLLCCCTFIGTGILVFCSECQ